MSNLFGSGSVLNNCTFNFNMNMAQAVPEPKKKYRRIIYSSDTPGDIILLKFMKMDSRKK